MIKRSVLFLSFFLFASIGHAELKIGYVNVLKLLEKAPQMEEAKKKLEKEFAGRDKHLVAQQKEIKNLEEKLARDASVMSESERRKVEREILNKTRDAKRSQVEFREDFSRRRNEELKTIQRRILEASKALAEEENFDLLIRDGVLFVSNQIDVTDAVQKRLSSF